MARIRIVSKTLDFQLGVPSQGERRPPKWITLNLRTATEVTTTKRRDRRSGRGRERRRGGGHSFPQRSSYRC